MFTLSLDFELIWGTLDLFGPDGFREACLRERAGVVDRLLALLVEHEVSATWLTVGHLLLDALRGPRPSGDRAADARLEPRRLVRGRSRADRRRRPPLFFARSLIERIRACPVPQEIGGHSFSHVIYGDPGCSRAAAESDLDALVAAASAIGLSLQSFSFPRNRVGHQDALVPRGFKVFRAPEPGWHFAGALAARAAPRPPGGRACSRAVRPRCFPRREADGLVSRARLDDLLPDARPAPLPAASPCASAARARGCAAAVRERGVFHLWTHPTNLADETEAMFGGLRRDPAGGARRCAAPDGSRCGRSAACVRRGRTPLSFARRPGAARSGWPSACAWRWRCCCTCS